VSLADVEQVIEQVLERLPGWCTLEKGKRLAALTYGCEFCVELGVFGARSLVPIGLALLDQRSGRADGIDPYTSTAALEGKNDVANDQWWAGISYAAIADGARDTIQSLALGDYVRLVRKRSTDAAADYADRSIDLLHQDSNHSELISCEEVRLWAPKMRAGGVWIFDDTNWPTTQAAQRLLLERGFVVLEDHQQWKAFRVPA
jgi:hypothetical protein